MGCLRGQRRLKAKYGEGGVSEVQRLRDLEHQSRRLKTAVAA
jgi:hypothetical protein